MSLALAKFQVDDASFDVQLNPESLQYDLTNAFETNERGGGTQKVEETTAKLSFELIWDTTETGQDVRNQTRQLIRLMQPEDDAPRLVTFRWGEFRFSGFVESYKEVLDFFSENGVPLRANTALVLTEQGVDWRAATADTSTAANNDSEPFVTQALPGQDVGSAVDEGSGDGDTGRGVGEASGLESIRNPGDDDIVVEDEKKSLADRIGGFGESAGAVFSRVNDAFGSIGGLKGFDPGWDLDGVEALGRALGPVSDFVSFGSGPPGFGLSGNFGAPQFGATPGFGSPAFGLNAGFSANNPFASGGGGGGGGGGAPTGGTLTTTPVTGSPVSTQASDSAAASSFAGVAFESGNTVEPGASSSWSATSSYEASSSWSASAGYTAGSAGAWDVADATAAAARELSGASSGYATAQWFDAPPRSTVQGLELSLAWRFAGLRPRTRLPRSRQPDRLLRRRIADSVPFATPTRFRPGGQAVFGDAGGNADTVRPLALRAPGSPGTGENET